MRITKKIKGGNPDLKPEKIRLLRYWLHLIMIRIMNGTNPDSLIPQDLNSRFINNSPDLSLGINTRGNITYDSRILRIRSASLLLLLKNYEIKLKQFHINSKTCSKMLLDSHYLVIHIISSSQQYFIITNIRYSCIS